MPRLWVLAGLLGLFGGAVIATLHMQVNRPYPSCIDPLAEFAASHPKLQFSHCDDVYGGQIMLSAIYTAKGSDYKEIWEFFSEHHSLPRLKWECCGLASGPGYGELILTPEEARRFPLNYPDHPEWTSGMITMSVFVDLDQYPNADITDLETYGEVIVRVQIAEV